MSELIRQKILETPPKDLRILGLRLEIMTDSIHYIITDLTNRHLPPKDPALTQLRELRNIINETIEVIK